MKPLIKSILIVFFFTACGEKNTELEITPFENQDISLVKKMKLALTKDYITQMNLPDSTLSYLTTYYKTRGFKPRWVNDSTLTKEGIQLKKIASKSYEVSIPKSRLYQASTDNYIQDEIFITLSLSRIVSDIEHGMVSYELKQQKAKLLIPAKEFDKKITFNTKDELRSQFLKFGPQDSTYHVIGNGLIAFVNTHKLDAATFEIKSIKYDSIGAIEQTKIALISKGYLGKGTNDSLKIAESLAKFQKENALTPDAVIGKYTSMALNESTQHKVKRIILAMDKIRSQAPRSGKFININIPEYKLRLYINDSLKSEHNIVVGKYENQTPELSSRLRKIVVYPYWNVPYSISSKEILPSVKRNVGYLAKHHYKIYKDTEEVDPTTVNWSEIRENSFPYKVVQDPGTHNSLGILKFDFNNSHSVYFHDTPSKGLFGVDVRAYSHGCMRTQNPTDLAKAILLRDEYNNKFNKMIPDSLDTLLGRGLNYEIRLLDPIPIFVEYRTVTRAQNEMRMHIDVYGRDEEFIEILYQ
ncbi:MAG: L,D-transpeptidase family protein [Crocinitomicaceae bacterium]